MDMRYRLAGALTALASLLPSAAHANCKIQSVQMPVTVVGSRPIVTVRINGTNVPMLLDTGAFFSMLTASAAAQLKLDVVSTHGRISVKGVGGDAADTDTVTVVHQLGLLGGDLPDVDFIVGGTEPGRGTMGIVGRNILSVTDTEYDLAHGVVRLVFPNDECGNANMAYWAGQQPVSVVQLLRDEKHKLPAILGNVTVNDKKMPVMFDTGASSTVMSLAAAQRLGLPEQDMTPTYASYGIDGKELKTWTARFATIDIGGETISNNRLRVSDMDLGEHDMLVGADFFLSHHVYVSKKRRLMFMTYNGGRVFAENVADPVQAVDAAASGATLDADGYARRGVASMSRGDAAGALADLDHAVALAPTSATVLAQRAAIYAQRNQSDKARADLDRALQIDPKLLDARVRRATLRANAKDEAGALADLAELDRQLAPEAVQRVQAGYLYMQLHQPAPAVAEFDQWIPQHPHEFHVENVRFERCRARVQLNTALDKAFDDCDAAVDANAKNAAFLGGRGWVYLRQGKLEKARSDFDRSLAIDPKRATELYGRGIAERRLGDTVASSADLDAARTQSATIDADMARFGLDK